MSAKESKKFDKWARILESESAKMVLTVTEDLCEDCPPRGYPTDETRCRQCPNSSKATGDVLNRGKG